MPQIIAILYWIWLLAAVGVLCFRIYERATGRRSRIFRFRSPPVDADLGDAPTPTSGPGEPGATAATLTHPSGDDIEPAVLEAMRTDDATATAPTAVTSAASGLFAPESRADHQQAEAVGTLAPLHETLDGIQMPCDLVPVTELGPVAPGDAYRERLVLMTTSAGAGEVAARVADELERLELAVAPAGPTSCIGQRRDHAVEVRVHEFPDRITENGAASFPTLPHGAVVVEFLAA